MNWGYKIMFVYLCFALGIFFLVYKSSVQKMDLVTTDYYAKELKYQDRIDEAKHVNDLSKPIQYQVTGNQLTIVFPADFSGRQITGEAVLYCPSDEDNDRQHSFSVNNSAVVIPLTGVPKGQYEIQVSWKSNGIAYYAEKKIAF